MSDVVWLFLVQLQTKKHRCKHRCKHRASGLKTPELPFNILPSLVVERCFHSSLSSGSAEEERRIWQSNRRSFFFSLSAVSLSQVALPPQSGARTAPTWWERKRVSSRRSWTEVTSTSISCLCVNVTLTVICAERKTHPSGWKSWSPRSAWVSMTTTAKVNNEVRWFLHPVAPAEIHLIWDEFKKSKSRLGERNSNSAEESEIFFFVLSGEKRITLKM